MRTGSKDKVVVVAKIPRADYARFMELMPGTGQATWYVRQAFSEFCEQLEADSTLRKRVLAATKHMLEHGEKGGRPLRIRIGQPTYKRFNRILPEYGVTSWFLRTWVRAYIDHMERLPAPQEQVLIAVTASLPPSDQRTTEALAS